MVPRHAAGAMLASIALLAPREASSQVKGQDAGRGAVVIAIGDATAAARPLAREVYADPGLRPAIDDATARALIGEPLPASPSAFAAEIAEARAAIASAGSETAERRLLASIGADARAAAVIAVTVRDGRPVARILRLPAGTFDPALVVATIEPTDPPTVTWPGALASLKALLTPPAAAPLAPAPARGPEPAPARRAIVGSTSMFSSPWFWGGLGAVATVGVTVFVAGNAAKNDDPLVRVQGRVAP